MNTVFPHHHRSDSNLQTQRSSNWIPLRTLGFRSLLSSPFLSCWDCTWTNTSNIYMYIQEGKKGWWWGRGWTFISVSKTNIWYIWYNCTTKLIYLRLEKKGCLQKIIRCPQSVQRAGPVGVKSDPGLAFATPMQQTHRTRMQIPAQTSIVVTSKAMLVPSVIDWRYVSCKH